MMCYYLNVQFQSQRVKHQPYNAVHINYTNSGTFLLQFVSITNKDNIFDVSKLHIHAVLTV